MDEDSHTALNQSLTEPWDRNLHARLLDHLTASGAGPVVFDIHFSGPGPNPEATSNLARAIQKHGRVVLGADIARSGTDLQGVGAKRFLPPFESLADAAAAIGSVEVDADHDLVVRKHLQAHPDDLLPSLAWSGLSKPEAHDRFAERWINYYGPPGTIPHLSYVRALTALPELFTNKV